MFHNNGVEEKIRYSSYLNYSLRFNIESKLTIEQMENISG